MSNVFTTFFHYIGSIFTNPKVEAAFNGLSKFVLAAEPVVAEIAALTPNKTVAEVLAAYEKYAVPASTSIVQDPTSISNALLNLASAVVAKNTSAPVDHVINTAVQIALTAFNASKS